MIIQKSTLTPEEIERFKNNEDVYNIVWDVSDRIGFSGASFRLHKPKIVEENGEFIAAWERDRTCG